MKGLFQRRWQYHLLIWGLALAGGIGVLAATMSPPEYGRIPIILIGIFGPGVAAVYTAFWARDRFFDRQQYAAFGGGALLGLGTAVGLSQGYQYLVAEGITSTPIQDLSNYFFLLLFALGIQALKRSVVAQFELRSLKEKQTQAELQALRAQLNPHFLLNTLNNIYAINQADATRGSDMLLELADVMRYHLEYSRRPFIDLPSEWQLLHAYIQLERLRLRDNCDLQVDLPDPPAALKIAPLILIIFVENAFKHGTLPVHPCFVHISARFDQRRLHFTISNSIIPQRTPPSTHVGLANTRRRLEMVYPEQHELLIRSNPEAYHLQFSLQL